ncbi:MAG: OB-fold nucleic acid binding domain-containing protein, partial [Patescibacteria group bacterium]
GKKDPVLLMEQRQKFIDGAVRTGHPEKFAKEVFEKVIEPFAAYGFNKSHAACYAIIAYQTAYLKTHYPTEFMAALLSTDAENLDRVALEVGECERNGIIVLPPSVNESFAGFTIVGEKKVRFGLKTIKGIGDAPIRTIIEARQAGGRFQNIEDFARRVPYTALNKKTLEALAYSGALDDMEERTVIVANVEAIGHFARQMQSARNDGQTDIFALTPEMDSSTLQLSLKPAKPSTRLERLTWEKAHLGLFVSGHPLTGLGAYLKKKAHAINSLDEKFVGKNIKIAGLVTRVRKIQTKNGAYMSMGAIEDPTGIINVVIFPKTYQQCGEALTEGSIVIAEGKCDRRQEDMQLVINMVKPISLDALIESAKSAGLYDENERFYRRDEKPETESFTLMVPEKVSAKMLEDLRDLLLGNKGDCSVVVQIGTERDARRIKVPFGVALTPGLKKKIDEVVQTETF